jgi:hypothetical protein
MNTDLHEQNASEITLLLGIGTSVWRQKKTVYALSQNVAYAN